MQSNGIAKLDQVTVFLVMSESPNSDSVCRPHKKLKQDNLENIADKTQQAEPQGKPNAVCNICQKKYAKLCTLYRHQRECHPGDMPFKSKAKKHACNVCPKTYTKKRYLSQHKIKAHPTDVSEQLEDASSEINSRKYICDVCEKKMSTKYNLKIHRQTKHGIFPTTSPKNHKCSLCESICSSKELFIEHLAKVHDEEVTVEYLDVESKEEFEDWKLKMEKETTSKYIFKTKYLRKDDLMTNLYNCHRNGRYITKGSGKRRLKIGGSIKSEYYCPSSIFVQAKSSETLFPAKIKFISTHHGHNREIVKMGFHKRKRAGKILSSIVEDFVNVNTKKTLQEEAKRISMGFIEKLDQYSNPEQCSEIIKTIAVLTHKCESLATKNQ